MQDVNKVAQTQEKKSINSLANEARRSLSKYCMEECKSYCCRKGYIILKPTELDLVIGEKKDKLMEEESLRELSFSGKFSFNLSNSFGSCTQLKDEKCLIHQNVNRPSVCKEFPIFITGKIIRISPRCYGHKAGLLYPFIKKYIFFFFL